MEKVSRGKKHCLQVCWQRELRGVGGFMTREQPALRETQKNPHSYHQESAHIPPTVILDHKVMRDPKSLISWLTESLCNPSDRKTRGQLKGCKARGRQDSQTGEPSNPNSGHFRWPEPVTSHLRASVSPAVSRISPESWVDTEGMTRRAQAL